MKYNQHTQNNVFLTTLVDVTPQQAYSRMQFNFRVSYGPLAFHSAFHSVVQF